MSQRTKQNIQTVFLSALIPVSAICLSVFALTHSL